MPSFRILTLFATLVATAGAADLSADAKAAAQRSISLIQKVNAQWKTPCVSCHHQILGALALEAARTHGLPVDENLAQRASTRDYKLLLDLDAAIRVDPLIDPALSEGSMLLGAHAAGVKPSLVTAAYARHIAGNQLPDGHWMVFDTRPPHSHSEITGAAIGAQAIGKYHPNPQPYLSLARQWLAAAVPQDTEGATFRLLGLLWTSASKTEIQSAATHLASLQHPDGSWAQTPISKVSDAYSTAEALYALRTSKSWQPDNGNFQRGVKWLLDHQAADGSWHVKSRINTPAPISPPYFESGFPYGHDQFLSMAATAWAVRALTEALPEIQNPHNPLPLPSFDATKLSWAETAMFGTPADLAKIDPNAKTPLGTTALMMAASDPAKIEVLLKRGAQPLAITKVGYDALMASALFYGNSKSVDLLLKVGIPAAPSRKIRFDASALAHAVMTNDPATVRLLLSKGANPNHSMRLLGGQPATMLNLAGYFDNAANIRLLVKAGAKIEDPDYVGMTSLSYAALGLRTESIKALLDAGANPKHKDKFGLIPLDHASAIADTSREAATILKAR